MTETVYAEYYQLSGITSGWRYYWNDDDWHRVSYSPSADLTAYGEVDFSFDYTNYVDENGELKSDISFDSSTYEVTLNGVNVLWLDADATIATVEWTMDGVSYSTTILEIDVDFGDNLEEEYEYGANYIFVLGGDALPEFSSFEEWIAFADTDTYITSFGPATGDLAPGETIAWDTIDTAELIGADIDYTGSAGDDVIKGGMGIDSFLSSEGDDFYNGGAGDWDNINYRSDPSGVYVSLTKGTATDGWGDTDTIKNIEMVFGSMFDDTLIGTTGTQIFRGYAGDDVINGSGGKQDQVRYDKDAQFGGLSGVTVNLKKGYAIDGFGDRDTLKNLENVLGSDSADKITGSGGNNRLQGKAGNDVINGLGGNDVLLGDDGKDKLNGGTGNDDLYGGNAADIFIFDDNFGTDEIFDFSTAGKKEKIDLSDVTSIATYKDLMNNHISDVGGNAVIDDGNGNTITIYGVTVDDLAKNDFVF